MTAPELPESTISDSYDLDEQARTERALRESEARLRLAMDAANAGAWTVIPATGEFTASDRALELHGLPPGTLMTHERAIACVHPDDRAMVEAALQRTIATGSPFRIELRAPQPDGSMRWLASHADCHQINGQLQLIGLVQDITERKRTEEVLRESQERFTLVSNTVPALIFLLDSECRYLFCNDAFTRWFGHPREAIIGKSVREFVGENAWRIIGPNVVRALAGQAVDYEAEVPYRFGGTRWVNSVCTPHFAEDGTVVSVVGMVTDINARKQAETALRASEERLRLAMEGADLGSWDVNLQTGEAVWNRRHATLQGYAPEPGPVSMQMWKDRVHPDDLDLVMEQIEQAKLDRGLFSAEHRVMFGEGREARWLSLNGRFTYDEAGEPVRLSGVSLDITERKRAEERQAFLLQLSDALRPLEDPASIKTVASRLLGLHLGVDRALHEEHVRQDGKDYWLVENVYHVPEYPLAEGLYPVEGFGRDSYRVLQGETVVVNDISTDDGIAPEVKEVFRSINVAAYVVLPIIRAGKPIALFVLNQATPRVWQPHELALLEETAERTWAVVEHARAQQALRENELRFRTLVEQTGDVFWVSDPQNRKLVYVSQAFADIWGRNLKDLYDRFETWLDAIHNDDRARVAGEFFGNIHAGTYDTEYRIVRPDGSIRWIRDRGKPLGVESLVAGVAEDITERKQAEETLQSFATRLEREVADQTQTLRENESMLRLSLDAANAGIWTWNTKSGETTWDDRHHAMYGFPVEMPRTFEAWSESIYPEDRSRVLAHIYQVVETPGDDMWTEEFRVHRPDGTEVWMLTLGRANRDAAGRAVNFTGPTLDITKRKQQERRIREQAELLEQVLESITVHDLDGTITVWNKGAERLFGWTSVEATGLGRRELFKLAESKDYQQALATTLRNGSWDGELQLVTKARQSVIVQSHWTLLRDEHHQPKGTVVIDIDITDRKELESRFLRSQRLESIGTLVSGIAHDLNNVLTPILIAIRLLARDITKADKESILDTARLSAERGAGMIRHLLEFASGGKSERSPADLNMIIKDVQDILSHSLPKSISLDVAVLDSPSIVMGDPTQLTQVLMNLCVNARDAMPDGGTLGITLQDTSLNDDAARVFPDAKPGSFVLLCVSDTGVGISREVLDKIFDPFFTTKPLGQGTGLGLSTVIGIVKSHGGFMNVESEVGKGTRFSAYLPTAAKEHPATQQTTSEPVQVGRGELIVLIDDEEPILFITKMMLESNGYRVLTANRGAAGVEIVRQHLAEVRLVLSDMMMPDMDGPATMKEIHAIAPNVPMIATSGLRPHNQTADDIGTLTLRFLSKPFDEEELLRTIAEFTIPN